MVAQRLYSLDTSCLINPWNLSHPPDLVDGLWDKIGEMIKTERFLVSEEVFLEVSKKDDLQKWILPLKDYMVPVDDDIQNIVKDMLRTHVGIVKHPKGTSSADLFVIAVAKHRGATVVTEEGFSNSPTKPKMPNVCEDYGIEYINFLELLRRENIKLQVAT